MPVVDLATGRARGAEALLRWRHPVGGLLRPDDFLTGMAHTSLMQEITGWVLRTAVAALVDWPGWTMSVNVTAHDVCRPALVGQVEDALLAAGVAAERLTLELTEQALVENVSCARDVLGALRNRGVGLSLDDFGIGYSSFLYLRDLPITELKVDRVFVSHTPRNRDDLAIVSSIARLGQSIGVAVVAEGVETRDQAVAVRDAGCTGAQGFLWGEPVAAEHVDRSRVELESALAFDAGAPPSPIVQQRSAPGVEGARIQELLGDGASLLTIAAALNREGSRTQHRMRWSATAVAAVIAGNPPRQPRHRQLD